MDTFTAEDAEIAENHQMKYQNKEEFRRQESEFNRRAEEKSPSILFSVSLLLDSSFFPSVASAISMVNFCRRFCPARAGQFSRPLDNEGSRFRFRLNFFNCL